LARNLIPLQSFIAAAILFLVVGCRDDEKNRQETSSAKAVESGTAELIFPESLRAGDESVNIFVRTALTQSAGGNYEAFRALWSAKQEPISRAEFDEGWQAVKRIEVRGLQQARLENEQDSAASNVVYVLLVEVALDPAQKAGQREPRREIVMMLVREHDQWRLAGAPKPMRDWIKQNSSAGASPAQPSAINP
jgi:hypothetical protein